MGNHTPAGQLSLRQARRLAIDSCLLGPAPGLGRGSQAVLNLVDRLGYVQIDSIAVVNRAHHHTVWSRLPGYRNGTLYELLRDRQLFEYWGHAASFMPMADFRYYLPLMQHYRATTKGYAADRTSELSHLFKPILQRIEKQGPLSSADFGDEHGGRRGQWWNWKPAKMALELLLWQGQLLVSERRGFQRVYDLAQRVLPAGLDLSPPSEDELARFLVRRALRAYGIATEKEIRDMLRISRIAPVSTALREMAGAGEIIAVELAGQPELKLWMFTASHALLTATRPRKPRLHILSPFDNMVIQRERLHNLFGFDYTIECYVPAPKRRYGYFSLPLMWDEQFVGRLDAKAHRAQHQLDVMALQLEDGFRAGTEFAAALAEGLRRFGDFNGCDAIRISGMQHNMPAAVLRRLQADLGS